MVITIYGNRKKSHDHINDISELCSQDGSEWYITSHTSIRFSQFKELPYMAIGESHMTT
jgi:hypothetical protein